MSSINRPLRNRPAPVKLETSPAPNPAPPSGKPGRKPIFQSFRALPSSTRLILSSSIFIFAATALYIEPYIYPDPLLSSQTSNTIITRRDQDLGTTNTPLQGHEQLLQALGDRKERIPIGVRVVDRK